MGYWAFWVGTRTGFAVPCSEDPTYNLLTMSPEPLRRVFSAICQALQLLGFIEFKACL